MLGQGRHDLDYMGPADKEPPKPGFEWLDFGEDRRYLRKYHLRCNYFQALEGDYDPSHAFFLHSTLDNNEGNPGRRFGAGVFNSFLNRTYADYIDTDYGVMNVAVSRTSDGQQQANVGHFYMPCYSSAGISARTSTPATCAFPIDDESCYMLRCAGATTPSPSSRSMRTSTAATPTRSRSPAASWPRRTRTTNTLSTG